MVTIYNTPLSTTSENALFGRPGGLYPCHEKRTKNPAERLEIDLKLLKIIIRFEECN